MQPFVVGICHKAVCESPSLLRTSINLLTVGTNSYIILQEAAVYAREDISVNLECWVATLTIFTTTIAWVNQIRSAFGDQQSDCLTGLFCNNVFDDISTYYT